MLNKTPDAPYSSPLGERTAMAEPWELMREHILKVVAGRDLTVSEAGAVMDAIISGDASHAQIGAFVMALRAKGEAATEIVGAASRLQERSAPLDLGVRAEALVEMTETGCDRGPTFAVSIGSALVAAASGVKVGKPIARGTGGQFGSTDVLAALGVNISAPLFTLQRCMQELGIAFVPPEVHSGDALAKVEPIRRELGFRTIFNILEAIVGPGHAKRQVIGVYAEKVADTVATVLKKLGTQHSMVLHGLDGLDQLSTSGKSKISAINAGQVEVSYIQPESFGFKRSAPTAYQARTAEEAALVLNAVLSGQQGPVRDVIVLNAAAAIRVGGFASTFDKAVEVAKRSLASGRPKEVLERLIKLTLL
jgi:anthranilate phosphoribosyltransferase